MFTTAGAVTLSPTWFPDNDVPDATAVGSRPSGDWITNNPPFGVNSHCFTAVNTVGSELQLFAAVCADVCAGQPRTCRGVNDVDPVPGVELLAFVPYTISINAGTADAVTPSKLTENSTIDGWFAAAALM